MLKEQSLGLFGLRRVQNESEHVEVSHLLEPVNRDRGYAEKAVDVLPNWAAEEWKSKVTFVEIHEKNEALIRFASCKGFHFWKQRPLFVFIGETYVFSLSC